MLKKNNYFFNTLLIAVLILSGILFNSCGNECDCPTAEAITEINIGALLDLTGDNALSEAETKAAFELALYDFNKELVKMKSYYWFKLKIEDTQLDPVLALQKMTDLYNEGIKVIIGLNSSSQVRNVMSYANMNHIVTASIASTAHSLGIPDDYIFRFAPDDNNQSKAITDLIFDDAKKFIIIVERDDTYGRELDSLLRKELTAKGITVDLSIKYNTNLTDYTTTVNQIASQVGTALGAPYTEDEMAVIIIGFDETAKIFENANDNNTLKSIQWYGTDGNTSYPGIIENSTALQFAESVKFTGSQFGEFLWGSVDDSLNSRIAAKLGKEKVSIPAVYAYDAMLVIMKSCIEAGEYDGAKIKSVLTGVSANYYGAFGNMVMNENGDMKNAYYDFWTVSAGKWNKTAHYEINKMNPEGTLTRY